jgi:hypothetical protein
VMTGDLEDLRHLLRNAPKRARNVASGRLVANRNESSQAARVQEGHHVSCVSRGCRDLFPDFGTSAHLSGTCVYVGDVGSARTGREDMHYHAAGSFPCGPATPGHARSWLLARIEEALAEMASVGGAAELGAAELIEDAALVVS